MLATATTRPQRNQFLREVLRMETQQAKHRQRSHLSLTRHGRILTATTTALIVAFGLPSPAVADPAPHPSVPLVQPAPDHGNHPVPAGNPAMKAQAPQMAAVAKIEELALREKLVGLAGTELAGAGIIVHWHGALPKSERNLIKKLDATVPIEVRPAHYSRHELDEKARALSLLPEITSAGVLSDGSGLQISYRAGVHPLSSAKLSEIAGNVPIRVRGPVGAQYLAWRWDDAPPFYAGAAILGSNGGLASPCTQSVPPMPARSI